MENTMSFRIRLTLSSRHGERYERTAYVAKRDGAGTWDGSWFTEREPGQIKTWKTAAGARRWLADRPGVLSMGAVVEVVR
jgi:hypothetical protein